MCVCKYYFEFNENNDFIFIVLNNDCRKDDVNILTRQTIKAELKL